MVLYSQAPRGGGRGNFRASRRRRSRLRPVIAGGALLLLLVLGIFWWRSGGEAEPTRPGETASALAETPATRPAVIPAGAPGGNRSTTLAERPVTTPETVAARPIPPAARVTTPLPAPASPPALAEPPARPTPSEARPAETRPPAPTGQARPAALPPSTTPGGHTGVAAAQQLAQGMREIENDHYMAGRNTLSQLLFAPQPVLSMADAEVVRDTLTSVNRKLVFSRDVEPGDMITEYYTVQPGDLLSRIAPRYRVPYQFVERVNGLDARNLRVGQRIKMVKGPIHARVSKREFRMDLFVRGDDGSPVFLCSFPVGLGEDDSTPNGLWEVERGRKVKNPDWRNPRTGEYFPANHPNMPIGRFWLALRGIDENTDGQRGYGIHGTNEPQSIGRMMSMGCVRLRDPDIAQVFDMLQEGHSQVEVVP